MLGSLLSFAGDLFSAEKAEDAAHANRISAEAQQVRNEQLQREFAQHGVRWRVEDAKAAGLHPLYALSSGGASYAPNPVVLGETSDGFGKAISNLGQNLSREAMRTETEEQRSLRQAQLAAAWASVEESDARKWMYISEAARNHQLMMGQPPAPPIGGSGVDSVLITNPENAPGNAFDQWRVKPDETPSARFGDMATTAGRLDPYWKEHVHQDKPGREPVMIALPRSDSGPGEMEIPWWRYMAEVIPENIRRYGWQWPRKYLFGGDPRGPTVSGRIRRE